MKRALLYILLAIFVGIVVVGARIVLRSGMLKTIAAHHSGECRTVTGVVGAEDVTIDPETMIGYLSSEDRRAKAAGKPVRGEIYALDLNNPDSTPVPLTRNQPVDFHPHGISLWRGEDGSKQLFVINHPAAGGQMVILYNVTPNGLDFVRAITYRELASPNDLVAVSARQFYASNDRGYREPGLMATLEAYLGLPFSSVSYFDGAHGSYATKGLVFANGVNRSADGRRLYVAECLRRDIRVYDRDPATGELTQRDVIPLGSCPDNIEVAEDGKLWVGAHPKIFDLVKYFGDATKTAPAQVLRVDPESHVVEEVFLDDGKMISAVSTASVAGNRMLLGSISDAKVLVCDRPTQ